jgi:hypothetical protein
VQQRAVVQDHLGDAAAVGDGAHHVGTEQQFHARIARQPLQHERQDGVVVGVVLALQRSASLHLPAASSPMAPADDIASITSSNTRPLPMGAPKP